jgi:hypothetical protein
MKIKVQKGVGALSAALALGGAVLFATVVGASTQSAPVPMHAATADIRNVHGSSLSGATSILNSSGGTVNTFTDRMCKNIGNVGRQNP